MPSNRRVKELKRKKRQKDLFFVGLMLLITCYFTFLFIFGEKGYMRYLKLHSEKTRIEKEIKNIKMKNKMTLKQIDLLKKDPNSVEGLARDMGYRKEGEIIFKFRE